MLRKLWFFFLVVVITGISIYSIVLMYQNDQKYEVLIDSKQVSQDALDKNDMYMVSTGDVYERISLEGTIEPINESEMNEVNIQGNISKIKVFVSVGKIVNKNEVYAEYRGKKYIADNKMCCIGLVKDNRNININFLDYSKLYIQLEVPQKYADSIKINQEVNVIYNERKFIGNVSYIDQYCQEGKVKVRVSYNNEKEIVRPGSSCKASLVMNQKKNVVSVPLEFIVYEQKLNVYKVLLINGNTSSSQEVKIGIIGQDNAEILSGLNINDNILLPSSEMSLAYYLSNKQEE